MSAAHVERLVHIMEAPDREMDLAEAALIIASEEYPELDVPAYLGRVARLAANVCRRLPKEAGMGDAVFAINTYLFDEEGFSGNRDVYDPRNALLNQVLELRRGGPLSIAILYVTVGRCLGLPLQPVVLPEHVLVKLPVESGGLILDPYAGGTCLDELALRALLAKNYGENVPADFISVLTCPAGKRDVVLRMVRELKHDFMQKQRYDKALWTADLLLRIAPEQMEELVERGYLYECIQHARGALADYSRYLELVPHAADADEIRRRIAALIGRNLQLH